MSFKVVILGSGAIAPGVANRPLPLIILMNWLRLLRFPGRLWRRQR